MRLPPPGPERRAQLEALGRRVCVSDFTPEELKVADESAQRALEAMNPESDAKRQALRPAIHVGAVCDAAVMNDGPNEPLPLGVSPFVQSTTSDDEAWARFGGQELDRRSAVSVGFFFASALVAQPPDVDSLRTLVVSDDGWEWDDLANAVQGFGLSDRILPSRTRADVVFMRFVESGADVPVETIGPAEVLAVHLSLVRQADGRWLVHGTGQDRDQFDEANGAGR